MLYVNGGFIVEDRTRVNDCTVYCGVLEIIRNKNKKLVKINNVITTCVTINGDIRSFRNSRKHNIHCLILI